MGPEAPGLEAPEAGYDHLVVPGRARRALGLISVSLFVIALTALTYLRPSISSSAVSAAPSAPVAYQLAGVDFVSPTTGWYAATFNSGRFAIMNTTDAGNHWNRQLAGAVDNAGVYINFFDSRHGVVAVLGSKPVIYRTSDGGHTWSSVPNLGLLVSVVSASYADPQHGWLLVSSSRLASETGVVRTSDGGASWTNLGSPVVANDQAYRVQFTDGETGWLDSVSSRPYAYKSADGGVTWRQVALPAPPGGWPATGQFFVAAQVTHGIGVTATVATFGPTTGRSGIGANVVAYPPLTVRAFDGGVPVFYTYLTYVDAIPNGQLADPDSKNRSGSSVQVQAPNQVQLGSLDGGSTWAFIAPPSAPGAIGYSDAQNWWWIGSGVWSRSSDGGATWSPYRNLAVPPPLPGSLELLDARHAWFGAMTGTRAVLMNTNDGGTHWQMTVLPSVKPS